MSVISDPVEYPYLMVKEAEGAPAFLTNFAITVAESLMQSGIDPARNEAKKTTHC